MLRGEIPLSIPGLDDLEDLVSQGQSPSKREGGHHHHHYDSEDEYQTASSISNEVNKQIVQNRHLHQGGEDQVLEGLVRDLLASQQQSNRVLVGVTCLTCLTCLLVTCFKK